jgi:hypothetical protein
VNETHNGNLNKSKQPAPAEKQGMKSAGKSNGPEATLRKGALPKSEAVREAKSIDGAAVKAAAKQNRSDEGNNVTVIPNKRIPAPPDTHGCEK